MVGFLFQVFAFWVVLIGPALLILLNPGQS
jgi:hypothetical protein